MTSMKTRIAACLAALLAGPAMAQQPPCAPLAQVRERLKEKYNEVEVAGGLVNESAAVIVFASPEGTWTAVNTTPAGKACITAVGEGWFQVRIPVEGERPA